MLNLNAILKKFVEESCGFYFQIFQTAQNVSNEFDFMLNKIIDIMKKNIEAFFHVDIIIILKKRFFDIMIIYAIRKTTKKNSLSVLHRK